MFFKHNIPLIFCLLNWQVQNAYADINQTTHGDCSPAIIGNPKVVVNCSKRIDNSRKIIKISKIYNVNMSQKVVDRLLNELDEKEVKQQELEKEIADSIQKYKILERQLAAPRDDVAKQAKALLDEGKLEQAEQCLNPGNFNPLDDTQQRELKRGLEQAWKSMLSNEKTHDKEILIEEARELWEKNTTNTTHEAVVKYRTALGCISSSQNKQ
jgi:hypothetical protein